MGLKKRKRLKGRDNLMDLRSIDKNAIILYFSYKKPVSFKFV